MKQHARALPVRSSAHKRAAERKAAVSLAEVLGYPVSVPIWPEAGRALGLSRAVTYELATQGAFPVPVLRFGRRLMVRRAELLEFLGIREPA